MRLKLAERGPRRYRSRGKVIRLVSRAEAAEIALAHALKGRTDDATDPYITVYSSKNYPDNIHLGYGFVLDEPAWLVLLPWFDGLDGRCLRSSHLIVVSRKDGRILYDGSANDEG